MNKKIKLLAQCFEEILYNSDVDYFKVFKTKTYYEFIISKNTIYRVGFSNSNIFCNDNYVDFYELLEECKL